MTASEQFASVTPAQFQLILNAAAEVLDECKIYDHGPRLLAMHLAGYGGEKVLATNAELAEWLGVSVGTVARWRRELLKAQSKSGARLVKYKPGGWRSGKQQPSEYVFDWKRVERRILEKLREVA